MIPTALALAFTIAPPGADQLTTVRAGLQAAEALTPAYESGGGVYQCGAGYAYSDPVSQHSKTHVAIDVATFAGGECTLVAVFHTHPKGDSRFSRDDIREACKLGVPSYILPHRGALRVFDCVGLPPSIQATAFDNPALSRGKEIA